MRGRALALTTMSAILLAGCETTSVPRERPSVSTPTTPTHSEPEAGGTTAVSTSTTAMLDKPEGGERWLCRDRWDRDESGAIQLVAVRARDATEAINEVKEEAEEAEIPDELVNILEELSKMAERTGEIAVAGTTHMTSFKVQGVNRRWNWSLDEEKGGYQDTLIIKPNGDADYYDFRGTERTKPSVFFKCTQG